MSDFETNLTQTISDLLNKISGLEKRISELELKSKGQEGINTRWILELARVGKELENLNKLVKETDKVFNLIDFIKGLFKKK